jgi:hypothetical protein
MTTDTELLLALGNCVMMGLYAYERVRLSFFRRALIALMEAVREAADKKGLFTRMSDGSIQFKEIENASSK